MKNSQKAVQSVWRKRLSRIIFEADTPPGKRFDEVLIACILLSVIVVMCDSVGMISASYGRLLNALEWLFTILFTIEYILRVVCADKRMHYARSFFGIVDLLAILPTYLSVIIPGSQYFLVIRILRVLRIFRVLKLVQFIGEARLLVKSLRASARKIIVFLFVVVTLAVVFGSLIYLIEGPQNGFTSIPRSIYWTIVTLTTVGYGDISPKTNIGQIFASMIMILGYSVIAVPTGIVTVEMSQAFGKRRTRKVCPECMERGHEPDAVYCKYCGTKLSKDV
jgi:voltage-gated potassium channel